MEITNGGKGASNQFNSAQGPSTAKHKNVIQILKDNISRTKPPDESYLKPTKAGLYGLHVRFTEIQSQMKKAAMEHSNRTSSTKAFGYLNSTTDSNVNYSLEGVAKHKVPIALEKFHSQQRPTKKAAIALMQQDIMRHGNYQSPTTLNTVNKNRRLEKHEGHSKG
jgi:hypothetical protein